jgi:hypothetical protein
VAAFAAHECIFENKNGRRCRVGATAKAREVAQGVGQFKRTSSLCSRIGVTTVTAITTISRRQKWPSQLGSCDGQGYEGPKRVGIRTS